MSIINIVWGENKGKDNFTTETLVVPVIVGADYGGGHGDEMSADEDAESNAAEQQV